MNLIFITRKIDRADSRAGFVFDWLTELALKLADIHGLSPQITADKISGNPFLNPTQSVGKLYVICQEKGDASGLPENVEIYSFGKDKGYGKLRQSFSLFALSFKLGRKSHGIFCHQMPIFAIMAWPSAKLLGKKLILWYTHKSVDLKLRLAHWLADTVLTASKESFRLPSKKVKVVGHGIPLNKFKAKNEKRKTQDPAFQIISVGRVSPTKDIESMIRAVYILSRKGIHNLILDIIGQPALKNEQAYLEDLKLMAEKMGLGDRVAFLGPKPYHEIPDFLQRSDLFINLSDTGSLDKAVLEAMGCGCLVLVGNPAFADILPPQFVCEPNQPERLAEKISAIMNLSSKEREEYERQFSAIVRDNHNLDLLVKKIVMEFR